MNNNKVSSTEYVVEPFQVDFTGHLFMSVLGNNLLNTAGFHANDRGFGIAELNQNKYTWVLSRLAVEMEEMPYQYEHYNIETWVENVFRLFTNRNFAITGADGKVYGYAKSIWAMIDLNSRKPEDLLKLHGGSIVDYIETDKPCPIDNPGRVKVTESEPVCTYHTTYSDIDINGHVNSVKYMEHMINIIPYQLFKDHFIKRFEIAYVAESYLGDTLHFFMHQNSELEYHIEIRKEIAGTDDDGKIALETVCRGLIRLF